MTVSIPTTEPVEARAGVTWAWRREDLSADYPASAWTLKYWFKKTGASGQNFSIEASADGDDFAVSVLAATSAAYVAGDYTWAAIVTGGSSEAYQVDSGGLRLLARYDTAANLDDRTHARKVLDAIEALIENRATMDQQEYSIGTRSLKRMQPAELHAWRDKYLAIVRAEEALRDGKPLARLLARF